MRRLLLLLLIVGLGFSAFCDGGTYRDYYINITTNQMFLDIANWTAISNWSEIGVGVNYGGAYHEEGYAILNTTADSARAWLLINSSGIDGDVDAEIRLCDQSDAGIISNIDRVTSGDLFDDGSINLTIWTITKTGAATITEHDGVIDVQGAGGSDYAYVKGNMVFGTGYIFVGRCKVKDNTDHTQFGGWEAPDAMTFKSSGTSVARTYNAAEQLTNIGSFSGAWHIFEIYNNGTAVRFWQDGTLTATHAIQVPDVDMPLWIYARKANTELLCDYSFVAEFGYDQGTYFKAKVPTVILSKPQGTYFSSTVPLNFSFLNFIDNPAPCWYNLTGKINNVTSLGNIDIGSPYETTISGLLLGNYDITVVCEDQGVNHTSNKKSFSAASHYVEYNVTFTSPEFETVNSTFTGKVNTTAEVADISANLYYADSPYPSSCSNVGMIWTCVSYKPPPLVTSNSTDQEFYFYYTITLANSSVYNLNGTHYNQSVYHGYWITSFSSEADVLEGLTFYANLTLGKATGVTASVAVNDTFNSVMYAMNGGPTAYYKQHTAPQVAGGNSDNYTLNATIYLTHVATSTSREIESNNDVTEVWKMQLLACGGLSSTVTLNITSYDEDSLSVLNGDHAQNYNVSSGALSRTYSFSCSNCINTQICIYPTWASFYTDSFEEYSATDYSTRNYFLTNASLTNVTTHQSIYLANSSLTKLTVITVKDENSIGMEEVVVVAKRYYSATNTYQAVEMGITDASGQSSMFLIPNTVWYQFVVYDDGTLLEEFPKQKIACDPAASSCTVTLQLTGGTHGEYYQYYGDVAHNCTFNNVTGWLSCSVTDTSGLMHRVNLTVWRMEFFVNDSYCSVEATSSPATLNCYIANQTGYYTWSLYAVMNDHIGLESGTLDFGDSEKYGAFGIIIAVMLVLALAGVGMFNPSAAVVMSLFAVVGSFFLGLVELEIGAIIGLVISGAIMVYSMRS